MRTSTLILVMILSAAAVDAQERPVLPGTQEAPFPQPASWVALTAVLEQDGVAIGRVWRSEDGSTRLELSAPNAEGHTTEIRNIAQRTFYAYGTAHGWTARPMLLPTGGWHPVPVAARAVGVKVGTTETGHDVYERRKTDGAVERRVPALNFLSVAEVGPDGRAKTISEVKLTTPAAGLFVPPANATVQTRTAPGGIVALPAPPK